MSAALILLPLLAQAGVVVSAQPDRTDRIDVAYEELAQGRPEAAIKRIEANRSLERDDPSRLINLGAAYAQLGDRSRAASYYRGALVSTVRYDVQLSDGTWLDSRRAARMGLEARNGETAIAVR
jgi:Tfp pilus assembly protein PilF